MSVAYFSSSFLFFLSGTRFLVVFYFRSVFWLAEQATPNITQATTTSTSFSTDYFIGHSFILTLSIGVLPSRCVVLCCITNSVLNSFFGRNSYLAVNSASLNCKKKRFLRRQPTRPRELTAH